MTLMLIILETANNAFLLWEVNGFEVLTSAKTIGQCISDSAQQLGGGAGVGGGDVFVSLESNLTWINICHSVNATQNHRSAPVEAR